MDNVAQFWIGIRPKVAQFSTAINKRPAERAGSTEYRALTWRDVEVLADAESVGFARLPGGARLMLSCEAAEKAIG